jgi:hypothetical protein
MNDRTLAMVMVNGIGASLTNSDRRLVLRGLLYGRGLGNCSVARRTNFVGGLKSRTA